MRRCWLCGWLAWIVIVAVAADVTAADFHVVPTGTAQGKGSIEEPWDLATALAAPAAVQPGDTIWLDAGVYRGGFVSSLTGRPDAPVVVRGAADGRVTIDTNPRDERDNSLFLLQGADAVYRDFEVTCSHPARVTEIGGPWPSDIRRGSVDVRGDRLSLVNLVVHDLAGGFGFWAEGEGGEISGCLIYNNGWQGPDRGHGHAIYTQNARGTKRIVDNVIFHQFAYGIHAYGSEKASLKGFDIEGNIAFENGCLARGEDRSPGIMVGGACPAERIAIRDNVVVGGNIRLGYPWGTTSEDVICSGNYCEGLVLRDFRQATVSGNTIVASSSVVQLEGAERLLLAGLRWDDNDYYVTDGRWGDCAVIEEAKSRGLTFDQWQRETGCDAHSRFTKGAPSELCIFVRPNSHEPGRAHVAVLNPALLPEVEVDLSHVLAEGQAFRVLSVKDFYGQPLIVGTYDGQSVRLPMRPVPAPPPVGVPDASLPVTEPGFAAFIVLPVELSGDDAADALLQAMRERLAIMHDVARWKWNHHKPIADPEREQALLDDLAGYAKERHSNLDPDLLQRFLAGQIEAGKRMQQADFDRWQVSGQAPFEDVPDLQTDLRPRIDRLSHELVDRLSELAPLLDQPDFRPLIESRAANVLSDDGIDDAVRETALAPLLDPSEVPAP